MQRFHQLLLIGTFLPLCWLGMMAVHELGHVGAAWASGATVTKVVLHPLAISRTDVSDNRHPALVVWSGPIFGVAAPLALWAAWRIARAGGAYMLQFFAGFCLIANGCYIGGGSFQKVGDAGGMLGAGSPIWSLWIFGIITAPLGLWLWNGLGPRFGLGAAHGVVGGAVDRRAAYVSAGLLLAIIAAEVSLSSAL